MMRVLVLGATGFIGTRVVEDLMLRKGAQARVVVRDYRRAIRLGRLPVEWTDGEAALPSGWVEAARGCDAVICCAHPFSSSQEAVDAQDISLAAAAAAAATPTRRLVFVSSTAVFAASGGEVRPDTAPAPDTPYGRIKLGCETLLRNQHDAGAIRLAILRPSIVYGPFSPSWTARPARQMRSGRVILPRETAGACNAIYVDDVARAVSEAIEVRSEASLVVNLNGPRRVSWREFYGHYERVVRPGAVEEWPLEAIERQIESTRRSRRGWSALKRAMRDRAVRDRLNEIPVLARLNKVGKSLGWTGLPPAVGNAPQVERGTGQDRLETHLPDGMFLDLYLRSPYVDGSGIDSVLGVAPCGLEVGMKRTLEWLEWAGLTRLPRVHALTS